MSLLYISPLAIGGGSSTTGLDPDPLLGARFSCFHHRQSPALLRLARVHHLRSSRSWGSELTWAAQAIRGSPSPRRAAGRPWAREAEIRRRQACQRPAARAFYAHGVPAAIGGLVPLEPDQERCCPPAEPQGTLPVLPTIVSASGTVVNACRHICVALESSDPDPRSGTDRGHPQEPEPCAL